MNIDLATGLPEVPADYFWRITKSQHDSRLFVRLIRDVETESRGFLGRRVVSSREVWVRGAYVERRHADADTTYEERSEAEAALGALSGQTDVWQIIRQPVNIDGYGRAPRDRYIIRDVTTTPERVLETAQKLWIEWDAEETERKRTEALLGDYPPKRLEVGGGSDA